MPSYALVHARGGLCTNLRKHNDTVLHGLALSLLYKTAQSKIII